MSNMRGLNFGLERIRNILGHKEGPAIPDKEFVNALTEITPENEARVRELFHKYTEIVDGYKKVSEETREPIRITPAIEENMEMAEKLNVMLLEHDKNKNQSKR